MVFVFARVTILGIAWLCDGNRSNARGRPLNQLVEFAPVEPDTPTLGTVVDFNALAFGHQKVGVWANGAFHRVLSCGLKLLARRGSSSVFDCLKY